jgi:GNAT superfamily N-acetyltransferase
MIRTLNESDINGLNRLPPIDWDFEYEGFLKDFLNEDFLYAFILLHEEKIVGTGNVFLKGKIGWLANIMVDLNYRGQGFGSEITQFLIDFLKDKKCETQLLIATKLGEPIYKKHGFKKMTEYHCFNSVTDSHYVFSDSIRALTKSDLESVYKLDNEANGEDRVHLIDKYYGNGLGYFNNDNELLGFYLPDFTRGLVVARDPQAGIELLKLKHSKKGKRTMLPIENHNGVNWLVKQSFQKGDSSSRMILGNENNWNPKYIYSYGSGFCG